MNKADLITKISQKTNNTKAQSITIIDAALSEIKKAVAEGEEVKILGFGIFTQLTKKERKGRNPKTGSEIKIPATILPKFKPSKEFKNLLLQNIKK